MTASSDAIPAEVKRTRPITDLTQLAAHFWPDDESGDDIIAFVEQQRLIDRTADAELYCYNCSTLQSPFVIYNHWC